MNSKTFREYLYEQAFSKDNKDIDFKKYIEDKDIDYGGLQKRDIIIKI